MGGIVQVFGFPEVYTRTKWTCPEAHHQL